jgi:tagatose-1,6-bisphosphate aldolase non-catalytic subunit AgaZ/GatZ
MTISISAKMKIAPKPNIMSKTGFSDVNKEGTIMTGAHLPPIEWEQPNMQASMERAEEEYK